jgi:hypothetical protein
LGGSDGLLAQIGPQQQRGQILRDIIMQFAGYTYRAMLLGARGRPEMKASDYYRAVSDEPAPPRSARSLPMGRVWFGSPGDFIAGRPKDDRDSEPIKPPGRWLRQPPCRQGLNVVFMSRQLGHAKSDVTMEVYAHQFAQREDGDPTRQALGASYTALPKVRSGS